MTEKGKNQKSAGVNPDEILEQEVFILDDKDFDGENPEAQPYEPEQAQETEESLNSTYSTKSFLREKFLDPYVIGPATVAFCGGIILTNMFSYSPEPISFQYTTGNGQTITLNEQTSQEKVNGLVDAMIKASAPTSEQDLQIAVNTFKNKESLMTVGNYLQTIQAGKAVPALNEVIGQATTNWNTVEQGYKQIKENK